MSGYPRMWTCLIVILVLAAGAGLLVQIIGELQTPRPSKRETEVDLDRYRLSGPKSLWIAAHRLGVPVEEDKFTTKEAVTLKELQAVAEACGLTARLESLSFDRLQTCSCTVVLPLQSEGYVAADPREKPDADGAGRIRIYKPGCAAVWWSREELEEIWAGSTLLLEKHENDRVGPHLLWDTLWEDKGVVAEQDNIEFSVGYRNSGTQDVTLEIVHTSCSCASANLTEATVPAGKSGALRVKINLSTRRGYFVESVSIRTNEEARPLSTVFLSGGALRETCSVRQIHAGALRPGGHRTINFFVLDPGDGRLIVDSGKWEQAIFTPKQGQVTPRITVEKIRPGSRLIGENAGGRNARVGDFAVDVEFVATDDCLPGLFTGEVLIRTNLPGKWSLARVLIQGYILTDLTASPPAILVRADEATNEKSFSVRISSTLGKEVVLERVITKGTFPVKIGGISQLGNGGAEFAVICAPPQAELADQDLVGALICEVRGYMPIEVPLMIVRTRQKK